ncbi:MAG: DUF4382 domain-containing protein [Flavobacteriales bacterium]|nr:DUF4382 domain-containing protein [Flavobacteriales bacterium]
MKKIMLIGLMAGLTVLAACKKDESSGRLQIRLTDAPVNYDAVWVEIERVDIHLVSDQNGGEWIELPTESGKYDLLELQNGIDTPLVDVSNLPAGKITQLRMILGSNNELDINGTLTPMKVPSGSQTGIKVVGKMELDPNQTLVVRLDFDAGASVVDQGSGEYHLKPVIKVLE